MEFTKMHGLGNDFIFFDSLNPDLYNLQTLAINLCDRHTGIGADGIVLVLPSEKADIRMRIINADGSEPNMCGNAIRCFAKYVYEKQIVSKTNFEIETYAGIIRPDLLIENNRVAKVRVDMGNPILDRAKIPMLGKKGSVVNEELSLERKSYHITSMLMNVPHTMVYVDAIEEVDVENEGRSIEKAPVFPEGTNVNFVEVLNENEIKVRTWERGAGATLACGTGCCASVVSSVLNEKTKSKVVVHLYIGTLEIEWNGREVFMTGPAKTVFKGEIDVENYTM